MHETNSFQFVNISIDKIRWMEIHGLYLRDASS